VKATGGNVCQLDGEKVCSSAMSVSTCVAPLLCAIDLQCRNTCTTLADCTTGQVCASGACAETTETNADGTLKVGAPPVDGGAPADGPMFTVDAPTGDTTPTTAVGPCGVPEMEPNDDRDHATPIAAPTMFVGCIGMPKDLDFYELTAPADAGGGYYQFAFTNVDAFDLDVSTFNAADGGLIGRVYTTDVGTSLYTYLAVAPGQKYRLQVGSFDSPQTPMKYTLNITYMKVDDAYEPNNTMDTAKPITLATPVMAYMFEGFRTAKMDEKDIGDWYSVPAAAGNLTVTVESVPTNMTAFIEIYDSANKMEYGYGPNDGANATATLMGAAAGTYKIFVHPFSFRDTFYFDQGKAATDIPVNYTHPYKLTVTQGP
jgi:hypothetical protein